MFNVYPELQLSPLVTVEEILDDELEDSFGEVVKVLEGVVLDLMSESKLRRSTFLTEKCSSMNADHFETQQLAYFEWEACLGHVPSSFFRSITSTC